GFDARLHVLKGDEGRREDDGGRLGTATAAATAAIPRSAVIQRWCQDNTLLVDSVTRALGIDAIAWNRWRLNHGNSHSIGISASTTTGAAQPSSLQLATVTGLCARPHPHR